MSMHWRYLKYVARHKWFVFLGCCEFGMPLTGIVHDLSKFSRKEWTAYARYFYGGEGGKGARGGYPKLLDTHGDMRNYALDSGLYLESIQEDFDRAWSHHQHKNPHHWQHFVLHEDSGAVKVLKMPDRYAREMIADWRGAGRAVGKPDTGAWYRRNAEHIMLHPETRAWVEATLGLAA